MAQRSANASGITMPREADYWLWNATIRENPELWRFDIPPSLQELLPSNLPDSLQWIDSCQSLRILSKQDEFFEHVNHALENGPGFAVLRRIPLESMEYRWSRFFYVCLVKSFGQLMRQDSHGNYFCDVVDPDLPEDEQGNSTLLGRRWNDLPLHTDHAFGVTPPKIIAFLCFRAAARGGAVRLASATTLLKRLKSVDPILEKALLEPIGFAAERQLDKRDQALRQVSVVSYRQCGLIFRYLSCQIDHEKLDKDQKQAISVIDDSLSDASILFNYDLKEGDVLLVNNFRIMHGREAYKNVTNPTSPRHHMRLWIA